MLLAANEMLSKIEDENMYDEFVTSGEIQSLLKGLQHNVRFDVTKQQY